MLKWPDQNVCDLELFLQLLTSVDAQQHPADVPIWVHCSGGIGRAGTFIVTHHERLKIRKAEKPRQKAS